MKLQAISEEVCRKIKLKAFRMRKVCIDKFFADYGIYSAHELLFLPHSYKKKNC